jgi:hypothetical protein
VGKELVTLFKNFCSDFDFRQYILFLGGVSSTLRIDHTKDIFDASNIENKALKKLKEGLKSERIQKTYIDDMMATDDNFDKFLNKVLFLDKAAKEYGQQMGLLYS